MYLDISDKLCSCMFEPHGIKAVPGTKTDLQRKKCKKKKIEYSF